MVKFEMSRETETHLPRQSFALVIIGIPTVELQRVPSMLPGEFLGEEIEGTTYPYWPAA